MILAVTITIIPETNNKIKANAITENVLCPTLYLNGFSTCYVSANVSCTIDAIYCGACNANNHSYKFTLEKLVGSTWTAIADQTIEGCSGCTFSSSVFSSNGSGDYRIRCRDLTATIDSGYYGFYWTTDSEEC